MLDQSYFSIFEFTYSFLCHIYSIIETTYQAFFIYCIFSYEISICDFYLFARLSIHFGSYLNVFSRLPLLLLH
jgi:hypothetical protein